MSHVAEIELHVYQGETWSLGIEMSGDDAPDDFDDDSFYLEFRSLDGALVKRLTVGDGISVTGGSPEATASLTPAETRAIPSGEYLADLFWVSGGTTRPLFRALVTVTRRVTIVEED